MSFSQPILGRIQQCLYVLTPVFYAEKLGFFSFLIGAVDFQLRLSMVQRWPYGHRCPDLVESNIIIKSGFFGHGALFGKRAIRRTMMQIANITVRCRM